MKQVYHAAALGTGAPICGATGKCVAVAPAVWHGTPVENRCKRCAAIIAGTVKALQHKNPKKTKHTPKYKNKNKKKAKKTK